MNKLRLLLLALAPGLFSCASVQWVPISTPGEPLASAESARITVAREHRFFLSGVDKVVLDDGQPVGSLAGKGHLSWERPAGRAVIGVGQPRYSQLMAGWSDRDRVELELDLEPGREYTLVTTPMDFKEAKRRWSDWGEDGVAWSWELPGAERGPTAVWELRLLEGEAASRAVESTPAARLAARPEGPEQELIRSEAGRFELHRPLFAERIQEGPSYVALQNRFGHALIVEWLELGEGEQTPTSIEELQAHYMPNPMPLAGEFRLLELEAFEHERGPMLLLNHTLPAPEPDEKGTPLTERTTLVLPVGHRLYGLSWQPGFIAGGPSGAEVWEERRARLLDLLSEMSFDEKEG